MSKRLTPLAVLMSVIVALSSSAAPGNAELRVVLASADYDSATLPIRVELGETQDAELRSTCRSAETCAIWAKQEGSREQTPVQRVERDGGAELWWLAPGMPPESVQIWSLSANDRLNDQTQLESTAGFSWKRGDSMSELHLGTEKVLRYHHPEFDPQNIEQTNKPLHAVFAPDTSRLLTKGDGGLHSHHRGIFFGYNNVGVDGDQDGLDLWHAPKGERTQHRDNHAIWQGPVFGGHEAMIDWIARDGTVFATERRAVRVFARAPHDATLIEVESTLSTEHAEVELGDDRQHAGLHFRASQQVADRKNAEMVAPPSVTLLP